MDKITFDEHSVTIHYSADQKVQYTDGSATAFICRILKDVYSKLDELQKPKVTK